MIIYSSSIDDIGASEPTGFFVGWPNPPSPTTLRRILARSYAIVLALDEASGTMVGFVNAISDGVLAAYIPLLEVLPEYHRMGIGAELMRRMLARLGGLYMVDIVCDEDVVPFYERLGMKRTVGMVARNYERQSGGEAT